MGNNEQGEYEKNYLEITGTSQGHKLKQLVTL